MKNIQVIDGAPNCAYDIFQATDEEFRLIFPEEGQDIQFIEDVSPNRKITKALTNLWKRRCDKEEVNGIHGTLFYELSYKKKYYPNRKDEDLTHNLDRAQL